MSNRWGVDSSARANHRVGGRTIFEIVKDTVQMPKFWGRYINGYSNQLTDEEIQFIRSESNGGCRIALFYNGPYRAGPTQRRPGRSELVGPKAFTNGIRAAKTAIGLAQRLSVPARVVIFADLERWSVDEAWFLGWFEKMSESRYRAGLYGNVGLRQTADEGFRRNLAYAMNTMESDDLLRSVGITEASIGLTSRPTSTAPLAEHAYVWSNRPYRNRVDPHTHVGTDLPAHRRIPRQFAPRRPPSHATRLQTVCWQYAVQVPLGTGRALVDFDLCTDEGLDLMWTL